MRLDFEQVQVRARKSFRCACGKRLIRSKRFWQTVNPWNLGASGEPKTCREILDQLHEERNEWMRTIDPCTHNAAMKAEGRAMFYWRKNSEWDDKRAAGVMAKRLRAAGYKARIVKKFYWRVVYEEPVPVGEKP